MDETQSQHFEVQQREQETLEIEVETKPELKEHHGIKNTRSTAQAEAALDDKKASEFKNSASLFFHFVRLMKLFPNVHPATLHTVLTMCKNDFFATVDRLLHAKHYKELYDSRRRMYQCTPTTGTRCTPYSCTENCLQNASCVRPTLIKRSSRKSRADKSMSGRQLQVQLQHQPIQESPITLQCTVPLRPLSPMTDDLPTNSSNVANVEEVQVVVTHI